MVTKQRTGLIVLGSAAGIGLGLWALTRRAGAVGPPPPPGPGLATIYGIVSDYATGLPLSNVNISLNDNPETTTNSSGAYTISNLPLGVYELKYEKTGYESQAGSIHVEEGNVEVNVALVPISPPGEPPPEEPPPTAKDVFYMPPQTEVIITDGLILDMYWNASFRCPITNQGDAAGTRIITIRKLYFNTEETQTVTLNPGQTYLWKYDQWIDFRRISEFRVEIVGNWTGNNISVGIARL